MIPFVPRKVARRSTIGTQRGTLQPTIPPVTSHETASSSQSVLAQSGDSLRLAESSTSKGKHKHVESPSDEDIRTFLCLSMSEHTMWSDPDLRRTLELSKEGCKFDFIVFCVKTTD